MGRTRLAQSVRPAPRAPSPQIRANSVRPRCDPCARRTAVMNRILRGLVVSCLAVAVLLLTAVQSPAEASDAPVPEVEVTISSGTVSVLWSDMDAMGGDYLGYVLDDFRGEFRTIDWVASNQLEFELPQDEDFQLRVIGYYHGHGWSEWGRPIRLAPGSTNAPPWTVRLSAGDRSAELSWADTGADEYRYHIWSGAGDHRYVWTDDGLATSIPDLVNGVTYQVTMMARYGSRYSAWTSPIPVTPNTGLGVDLLEREPLAYEWADLDVIAVFTITEDPGNRVDQLALTTISAGEPLDSAASSTDATIEVPGPTAVGWRSDPIAIGERFTETITVASDSDDVVASSLQTFMSGNAPNVDLTIAEGTRPGRRGVFR